MDASSYSRWKKCVFLKYIFVFLKNWFCHTLMKAKARYGEYQCRWLTRKPERALSDTLMQKKQISVLEDIQHVEQREFLKLLTWQGELPLEMSHLLLLFLKYFSLCAFRRMPFLVRGMLSVSFLVVVSDSLNSVPTYSEVSMEILQIYSRSWFWPLLL